MTDRVIIGSRESKLAVLQSEMVRAYITEKHPQMKVEILTMKTTGDIILDRTLDKVGGKGLFVKELDRALLEGRSHLSVHSLKDMPMEVPFELPASGFFQAGGSERCAGASGRHKGAGTREASWLFQLKKNLAVKRIVSGYGGQKHPGKSARHGCAGWIPESMRPLILAAAGLKRLGLENRIARYFTPDEMIPAAGQGILAVQGKAGNDYGFWKAIRTEMHGLPEPQRGLL